MELMCMWQELLIRKNKGKIQVHNTKEDKVRGVFADFKMTREYCEQPRILKPSKKGQCAKLVATKKNEKETSLILKLF